MTLDFLRNAAKQNSILSMTAGIIFLGTPHSGTVTSVHERITQSTIISLLLATSDLRLEGEVLKNVQSPYNTLSDISKEFLDVCSGYHSVVVINFYEQRASKVGKIFGRNKLVVSSSPCHNTIKSIDCPPPRRNLSLGKLQQLWATIQVTVYLWTIIV